MVDLTTAEWTRREDLAQLVAALGAENLRWVGGAVRDTLLGMPVKDIDAATTHPPETVMARLDEAGIRYVPTGLDHGTLTAVLDGGPVEVTTLRKDVATDGRRATVAFAQDWQDDAARRDFTINALYAHPETLEISDYFGGLADLEARRVRFIGDAAERIREDHLRILRYYRFQARFGSTLDEEGEEGCAALAPTLKGLSRERVAMELLALLALPDPHETVERMHQRGVLPVILPETGSEGLERLAALIAAESAQGAAPDPIRRLAALLPAEPRTAQQVAARLRLSNAQRKRLSRLADRDGPPGDPHILAYREGMDAARDLLLLSGKSIAPLAGWQVPEFPLRGGTIVERGVGAGPEVARIMQAVERRWLEEGFPGESRVEQMLAEELSARD
ncbi:CCA tRNA nucleotidyltransferase [Aurantiacibacter poecillastricola]|uniref:CCA tRNA nucleotidyltransferase n=1 Tax=Aurantiacibacter poecillastricola TaxID=3064385 RepID=UPI00273F6482|nr:CCA tRNA nucleotidyltransferase [Aurantiacibacter sp. 219JJ12-13]MDP5262561.1 CCA tRNA nucleotidyltransferase [Aurantiacibacter sp. 219JJ12-13]